MSLWEKWEREKLEKQGIKVEHHSDVEIHDTRSKVDVRTQIWTLLGAVVACLAIVYAALVFEALLGGRPWTDTYIVRLIAAKEAQRQAMSQ
ncbi:MAG: hypothetical protein LBS00_01645 [Synergistaceae bacterium]|jgi:hypothetical protein|nr:hypothetical protein [Synergistaceae bacterium]